MMRQKRWFPVLYMFVMTAAFSSIVIGFTGLTRHRVEANEALAFERAVVTVFPALIQSGVDAGDVHRLFTEQMTEPDAQSGQAYTLRQSGRIVGYALPFAGQGFWAPVKGIIGIDTDKRTVTAIAFYEQKETPGLGAEIAQPPFKEQFQGKALAQSEKPIRFRRRGEALGDNEVHAVTGATQTSTRVEAIINNAIRQWQAEMSGEGGSL